MKTEFGVKAQLVRYQGIILALLLSLSFITGDFYKNPLFFSIGITLFAIGGIIVLWLYPLITISNNGLKIKRLFFTKLLKFDQINVKLKTKKLFKSLTFGNRVFGIDQRYAVISDKNDSLFGKWILLTAQMQNFDSFICKIGEMVEIKR